MSELFAPAAGVNSTSAYDRTDSREKVFSLNLNNLSAME
jgi:hypothetical protein